ncbi:hypothetical protein ADUPG1_005388, partial [Aduncisulcus paluster]
KKLWERESQRKIAAMTITNLGHAPEVDDPHGSKAQKFDYDTESGVEIIESYLEEERTSQRKKLEMRQRIVGAMKGKIATILSWRTGRHVERSSENSGPKPQEKEGEEIGDCTNNPEEREEHPTDQEALDPEQWWLDEEEAAAVREKSATDTQAEESSEDTEAEDSEDLEEPQENESAKCVRD